MEQQHTRITVHNAGPNAVRISEVKDGSATEKVVLNPKAGGIDVTLFPGISIDIEEVKPEGGDQANEVKA